MFEKKRDMGIFLAGLVLGLLILILFYFIALKQSDADNNDPGSGRGYTSEYDDVHIADWDGVDIKSAQPFIKEKSIQVIAFVDENGGFYIANRNGEKIEGWCKRDGTKIGEKCSDLLAHKFLYANQLTFIITEGSPGRTNIINGGSSICIDPKTGRPCR